MEESEVERLKNMVDREKKVQRDSLQNEKRKAWVVFHRTKQLKPYLCDGLDLRPGDAVVAPTEKGLELGIVAKGPVAIEGPEPSLPRIDRLATKEDLEQWVKNRKLEREALQFCLERIKTRNIPMKPISVESTLDRSKILFNFTSEGRVDFRELVKDLAKKFKARIEMRQIGIRDETKLLGGMGPCGKQICCSQFIREFAPISIKMAKEQYLILNPSKISGLCGRLMCCLAFEYETYREASAEFPKVGEKVKTRDGQEGEVVSINIMEKKVLISLQGGQGQMNISLSHIIRKKGNKVSKEADSK